MPSCDPVTRPSEAQGSPGCSGSFYDFVVFGKEKLHFFHRDGEEEAVGGGGQSAGVGTGVMFSGGKQTFLLSWLGETHAGDTEDTDEASVLEALESSELSSTFFPKSCNMQFRNWQDRKCYSTEQKGRMYSAKGHSWGILRKVFIKGHLNDLTPSLLLFRILYGEWRKPEVITCTWG